MKCIVEANYIRKMFLILTLVACALAAPDEYIIGPEDPHNADNLPDHPEAVKFSVDCFIDKGPCDELNQFYKNLLPDIVRRECSQCSPYLKHYHNVFLKELKTKFPEEYQAYKQKYDPEGIHFDHFEAVINNL